MATALVVITDGRRQYLERALASADKHLPYFDYRLAVDDSADLEFGRWLNRTFDGGTIHHGEKEGLSGAVRTAWEYLPAVDWVFHLEDDFVFPSDVPFDDMVDVCQQNGLAQMCLVRQPCNPTEAMAGGLLEGYPAPLERHDGFVTQSHLFSLNPCVYPAWVRAYGGWPEGGGEREFTDQLHKTRPDAKFGYWGEMGDPPRCIHIGASRTPTWKL